MVRPRKTGKGLPEGLYPPSSAGRSYRIRDPLSGRFIGLKTKDEGAARKIHAIMWPQLLEAKLRAEAEALHKKLAELSGAKAGIVSELAREMLALVPTLSKRDGKLLSKAVQKSYRQILNKLIASDFGQTMVSAFAHTDDGPRMVRAYLAPSLQRPSWYNTQLGVLSRLFKLAIDKGDLARNPCDPVKSLNTPSRKVYIADAPYIEITGKLASEFHEVYAKCCDLIYLLSSRNTDALTIEEGQIETFPETYEDADGNQVVGVIKFTAAKNGQDIDMAMNPDLLALVEWFRAYKRREGIVHPRLCLHPIRRATVAAGLTVAEAEAMSQPQVAKALGISVNAWRKRLTAQKGIAGALAMGGKAAGYACSRKLAGKPITNAHLRERFIEAKALAGYGDVDYTLRDLRPKGLTDEAKLKGEATNKGGWKPGSKMPQVYVKTRLPVRTANNLKTLRKG